MEAIGLIKIFPEGHIKIICWTLIHSLWIGLLIAGLAGIVLMLTQKTPARVRYQLLCGCLIMFVLITGLLLFRGNIEASKQLMVGLTHNEPDLSITSFSAIDSTGNYLKNFVAYIDRYSVWVFAIWFLIFNFKIFSVATGLFYIYRIRTYRVHAVGEEWTKKMDALRAKLGIRQTVKLLQSELVKVPLTLGHIRPLILIPVGLFFQLPPGQAETILLHELAHIQRRDYLINLLQSLVETIFFFNPALLWLSARIREEREACCDDIVLAHTSGKSEYLEALLTFHQIQTSGSNLVMGIGGNALVNRLKRIINHENKRLNKMEKVVLLGGLLIVSAFSYLPEPHIKGNKFVSKLAQSVGNKKVVVDKMEPVQPNLNAITPKSEEEPVKILNEEVIENEVDKDTLMKLNSVRFENFNGDMSNRNMSVEDDKGNSYQLKIVDNKLTSLRINGVDVPENELDNHKDLVAQIDKAWAVAHETKRRAMAQARVEWKEKRLMDKAFRKDDLKWKSRAYADMKSKDKDRKEFEKSRKAWKIEKDNNKDWKNRDEKYKFKDLKKEDWKRDDSRKDDWRKGDDEFSKRKFNDSPEWRKKSEMARSDEFGRRWRKGVDKEFDRGTREENFNTPRAKRMPRVADISADQARVKGIIGALVDEKVITQPSDLEWFGLSEGELVVNGKKQSPELQEKLKAKYNIKAGQGLYYGPVKMNGQGVFLDKEDVKTEH